MDIQIDKDMLERILNDDIESELQQIIHNELSKPESEMNLDEVSSVYMQFI